MYIGLSHSCSLLTNSSSHHAQVKRETFHARRSNVMSFIFPSHERTLINEQSVNFLLCCVEALGVPLFATAA